MKIAFAALDLKMGESGFVSLEKLQMENSALKALNTEIRLQLSEAKRKALGEKAGEKLSKNNSALVLRARIKSNGKPLFMENCELGSNSWSYENSKKRASSKQIS